MLVLLINYCLICLSNNILVTFNRKHFMIRNKLFFTFLILSLATCKNAVGAGDRVLLGLSEAFGATAKAETIEDAVVSCTTDVTVSTKTISLSEDGDVNSSFSTLTDNGLSNIDEDGGTSWGYHSFETCLYLNTAFTGSVEIPISTNATYTGRLDTKLSFPAPVDGDPLPDKFTFIADGVANRQCVRFTRVIDTVRNPIEEPFEVNFANMIQKDGDDKLVENGVYSGKFPCGIKVSVEDDEGPGIRVSNISQIMEEPGVAPPNSGTFSVVLRVAPTADVTIGINETYDPVNSGNREGTVSPNSLTFTAANFNIVQLVTVTSVDDLEVDGLKIYTIRTNPSVSEDPDYNGIKPRDVVVYNKDQSVPGYAYERFEVQLGQLHKLVAQLQVLQQMKAIIWYPLMPIIN